MSSLEVPDEYATFLPFKSSMEFMPFPPIKASPDYVLEFDKKENISSYVYDCENQCFQSSKTYIKLEGSNLLPLSSNMFDNDAIYLRHTASRGVSLINPKTHKGIHVDYPGFSSLAVWTKAGGKAPFVCLETWNGSAIFDDEDDIFCHKRDIEALKPHECTSYGLEISLLGY